MKLLIASLVVATGILANALSADAANGVRYHTPEFNFADLFDRNSR